MQSKCGFQAMRMESTLAGRLARWDCGSSLPHILHSSLEEEEVWLILGTGFPAEMKLKNLHQMCPRFSLNVDNLPGGSHRIGSCSALERFIASVPQSIGTKPQQVFRSILLFKLTIVCKPKRLYLFSLGSPRRQTDSPWTQGLCR